MSRPYRVTLVTTNVWRYARYHGERADALVAHEGSRAGIAGRISERLTAGDPVYTDSPIWRTEVSTKENGLCETMRRGAHPDRPQTGQIAHYVLWWCLR